jgi:hypothetical protein
MGKSRKNVALILILSIVISSTSLLVKSTQAQSNTAPTISILSPTNGTVFELGPRQMVTLHLNYQTKDTISWAGYSINGAKNVTIMGNCTFYDLADSGYRNLTFYANDTTGNWAAPQTVTWRIHVYSDELLFYAPLLIGVAVFVVIAIVVVVYFRRK